MLLATLALGALVHADENLHQADGAGHVHDSLKVDYAGRQRTLLETGRAVRKILFMEIYTMAHYLESDTFREGESVYRAVVESPGVKQTNMVFSRDLRADQIQKSLRSGIKANSSEASYDEMQPDVEAFMSAITDGVNEGDEFVLRWYPDGTLQAFFEGHSISSIRNNELAKTMWAMWFGERAVVDRSKLVEHLLIVR